jgi:predicted Zn finger-like uncharacterized protein
MIIECPACTTRYDIKAQLPPEGRTVRCAKCGNVWRAMREESRQPEPQTEKVARDGGGNTWAGTDKPRDNAAGLPEYMAQPLAREAAQIAPDLENGVDQSEKEDAAIPHPQAFEASKDLFQAPAYDAGANGEKANGAGSEREGAGPPSEEHDQGKVRWFGSFLRRNNSRQDENGVVSVRAPNASIAAETIPFPRTGSAEAKPPEEPTDQYSLDEARAAVRNVFGSLRDQEAKGKAFSGSGGFADGRVDGKSTAPANGWSSEDASGEAGQDDADGWPKSRDADAPSGSSDPDADLRNALRIHFARREQQHETPETFAAEEQGEPDAGSFESTNVAQLSTLWHQEPSGSSPPEQPVSASVEEVFGDVGDGDSSFDPRLYREIEETQDQWRHQKRQQSRGGLAFAAAWGLFLCTAAGLLAGLFGFRDITAGAIPGLVPLYNALGLPITDQPLIFEGVQYDWAPVDNKPALVIKGAVYNRAARSVKIPDFVIAVKDGDPALDREFPATLQVAGPKIGPEERAEFEIELVSPSPSITAIELELRAIR